VRATFNAFSEMVFKSMSGQKMRCERRLLASAGSRPTAAKARVNVSMKIESPTSQRLLPAGGSQNLIPFMNSRIKIGLLGFEAARSQAAAVWKSAEKAEAFSKLLTTYVRMGESMCRRMSIAGFPKSLRMRRVLSVHSHASLNAREVRRLMREYAKASMIISFF
jgi:hypothetical protein